MRSHALALLILLPAGILAGGCADAPAEHVHRSFDRTGPGLGVTWHGRALELEGRRLKVGDPAPDAAAYDTDYQAARLSSYRGKVVLLSVVPEFGTPVCDQTTQRLEHLAGGLGPGVAVLTVSRDSVWDQRDWCRQRGIERVEVLSDDQLREFGRAYGLSIRGRDALMRAMLVLDREGVIRHIEVVDDVSHHPDIGAAVAAARALAGRAGSSR